VEAEQVFLPLPCAVHLHDRDRETVGRGGKHSRCQGMVILIQEFLKRVLLHVNFVEFIGSDEDTVIGEVDAAAGL